VRSWVDVVRQEIQPTCYIVTNDLVMLRGNDTCFATFIAETPLFNITREIRSVVCK
jgi:hypothetical protein